MALAHAGWPGVQAGAPTGAVGKGQGPGAAPATRLRLVEAIRATPGLSLARHAKALGVAQGTVAYHAQVLLVDGLVVAEARGREKRLFPRGTPRHQFQALSALAERDTRLVLARLRATPDVGVVGLSREFGASPKVIRRHLSKLLGAGLAALAGRKPTVYRAVPGWLGEAPSRILPASRARPQAPPRAHAGRLGAAAGRQALNENWPETD